MSAWKTILAVGGIAFASPAYADEFFAVTPSGAAEMLFPMKPKAVIGKLSSTCIDSKWTVISSSSNELVCEAPMSMGQSILGQMMMGNSYSTPPRRFFRFNVAEIDGISRVQASGWMELQMAFGQMKRTDFSGPEFHNSIMTLLGGAGGKFPVGTTFPNHVMMGFQSEDIMIGKYHGLRITSVEAGSSAEKAGMQVGDVVTRVAGERFKAFDDFLDATAEAAEDPTYEVEITRAGKPMKLTLERAFRPTWQEKVVASAEPPQADERSGAVVSVADELAKLAKLKDDDIITEAEFEAQKKKLLGL